ncbi:NfeD family protein [Mycoplasmatota bacterium zrk1]
MFNFLETAEGITRIYGYIAIFGTTIFIIINLLMLVGLLDEIGIELDFDLEAVESTFTPFKLLTFRGVVSFIMFFGWGGYLYDSVFYATLFGTVAFISIGLIYFFAKKLQQKGNYVLQDAIGREGKVYLRIKGDMSSIGKVLIKLSSGVKEIDAISEESLKYNDKIVVVDILENKLIVEKIKGDK